MAETAVIRALAEAKALGFLGPGELDTHVRSAAVFASALGDLEGRALDLGTGGGAPGLLLAGEFPGVRWVFVDRNRRRSSFLARSVAALGWASRVTVLHDSAEVAAHEPLLRGSFDAVTARSFAAPAITAECAAGFLRREGLLVVAEPPEDEPTRWPPDGLRRLGFGPAAVAGDTNARVAVLMRIEGVPPAIPRAWRTMASKPAW